MPIIYQALLSAKSRIDYIGRFSDNKKISLNFLSFILSHTGNPRSQTLATKGVHCVNRQLQILALFFALIVCGMAEAQQGGRCQEEMPVQVHPDQRQRFESDCTSKGGKAVLNRSGGIINPRVLTCTVQVERFKFCNVQLTGDYSQPVGIAVAPQPPPAVATARPVPAQPAPIARESDGARARLISEMRSQPNPFASLVGAAGAVGIPITTAPDDRTKLESALCRGVADCDARLSNIPKACRTRFHIVSVYDEGLDAGPSALTIRPYGPTGFSVETGLGVALDMQMPDSSLMRIGQSARYEIEDCTKTSVQGDKLIGRMLRGMLRRLLGPSDSRGNGDVRG